MPRTVNLTCDRLLTDKVTAGNRVKIIGILCIAENNNDASSKKPLTGSNTRNVRTMYIRVIGMQSEINKDGANSIGFAIPNIT